MTKAILWDLDGTLWDACDRISVAWNELCEARGEAIRFTGDVCRSCCGKTLPQIAGYLFPDRDRQWAERFVTELCDAECIPLAKEGGRLYDREREMLENLHKTYFMAVVSNCGLHYIESFFQGNHMSEYFDDYENAARTGLEKGDNIRLVMERNHLDFAVYIGDTEGDQAAARQAGIPFIHAAYGFGQVKDAEYRIQCLSQLPEVIDSIEQEYIHNKRRAAR